MEKITNKTRKECKLKNLISFLNLSTFIGCFFIALSLVLKKHYYYAIYLMPIYLIILYFIQVLNRNIYIKINK